MGCYRGRDEAKRARALCSRGLTQDSPDRYLAYVCCAKFELALIIVSADAPSPRAPNCGKQPGGQNTAVSDDCV